MDKDDIAGYLLDSLQTLYKENGNNWTDVNFQPTMEDLYIVFDIVQDAIVDYNDEGV